MSRQRRFLVSVPVLIALGLTACGTRVDRATFERSLQGRTVTTTTGGSAGGSSSSRNNGSTSVLGNHVTRGGGSSGGSTISPGVPSNVSTTVVGKTITVGIHVPETGAAPLPTNWQDALTVVQRYSDDHPIFGRTIRFAVEDDGYDPAKGLAACRKLGGEDPLFVIGHTLPTIEDGCASLFNSRGIPYLMRGVPESYLKNRPLAYFGTASDDVQAKLLADYALANLGAKTKNVGVVTENDQPVSKNVFGAEIARGGGKVVIAENSVPRQPDFGAIIAKLQNADAKIVFLNIAPVDAIKIAVQSQSNGYHPTWIGEGTHWNYNLSMQSAGAALDGAVVFSPWSSIDSPASQSFKDAFKKYAPNGTPDDIGLIIWGWAMLSRAAIEGAGSSLSRATFVNSLNHLSFDAPFWQPIHYTATNHSGASSVAVFRGDGQAKRWIQIQGFTSRFS